jgi:hypothetical protein
MEEIDIFYGTLVYFTDIWYKILTMRYISWSFGIFPPKYSLEKSGNPDSDEKIFHKVFIRFWSHPPTFFSAQSARAIFQDEISELCYARFKDTWA